MKNLKIVSQDTYLQFFKSRIRLQNTIKNTVDVEISKAYDMTKSTILDFQKGFRPI